MSYSLDALTSTCVMSPVRRAVLHFYNNKHASSFFLLWKEEKEYLGLPLESARSV